MAELTKLELFGLLALFIVTWSYFFAWFFETIFAWDKATGDDRKRLSTKWHALKAVIVGEPTALIAWLIHSLTWTAVLWWAFMAFLMWIAFDYLLNRLRNLKPDHKGKNILDRVPTWIQAILLIVSIILIFVL